MPAIVIFSNPGYSEVFLFDSVIALFLYCCEIALTRLFFLVSSKFEDIKRAEFFLSENSVVVNIGGVPWK